MVRSLITSQLIHYKRLRSKGQTPTSKRNLDISRKKTLTDFELGMGLVIKAKNNRRDGGRFQVAMHRNCHLFVNDVTANASLYQEAMHTVPFHFHYASTRSRTRNAATIPRACKARVLIIPDNEGSGGDRSHTNLAHHIYASTSKKQIKAIIPNRLNVRPLNTVAELNRTTAAHTSFFVSVAICSC